MKREDLFLTRDQCLHLQELGLDMSDAAFGWTNMFMDGDEYQIAFNSPDYKKNAKELFDIDNIVIIPTYTLQEIFDKLPKDIKPNNCSIPSSYYPYADLGDDYVVYSSESCIGEDGGCTIGYNNKRDTLMESAYNMLVWCLENNYLKGKDK